GKRARGVGSRTRHVERSGKARKPSRSTHLIRDPVWRRHGRKGNRSRMAIVEQMETRAGERRRLWLKSPVTLEPIGEIEVANAADVAAAVARARAAQK